MQRMLVALLLVLPALPLHARELAGGEQWRLDLSGYIKSMSLALDQEALQTAGLAEERFDSGTYHRARFRLRAELPWEAALAAEYELMPRVPLEDAALLGYGLTGQTASLYRYDDLDRPRPIDEPGFLLAHDLDRLYLTLALPWADLTLGRQAVAWGAARAINPTDVWVPFNPLEFDREEKPGVDAARISVPLGDLTTLDLVYIAGRYLRDAESGQALRFYRSTWTGWDYSLVAERAHKDWIVGGDVYGPVLDAGFWIEGTWTWRTEREAGADWPYARVSAGAEYKWVWGLTALLEIHFNGAGIAQPEDYLAELLAPSPGLERGERFTLGRWYLIPAVTYELTPLITVDASVLLNLADGSAYWQPRLTWSAGDNATLEAGAAVATGKGYSGAELRSEFGAGGDMYYIKFNLYF